MASVYLLKAGWNAISICLKYFSEIEPENSRVPEQNIPNQESPFAEKLIYVLMKLDENFRSGIFRNLEPLEMNSEDIVKKSLPLPSVALSGKNYLSLPKAFLHHFLKTFFSISKLNVL